VTTSAPPELAYAKCQDCSRHFTYERRGRERLYCDECRVSRRRESALRSRERSRGVSVRTSSKAASGSRWDVSTPLLFVALVAMVIAIGVPAYAGLQISANAATQQKVKIDANLNDTNLTGEFLRSAYLANSDLTGRDLTTAILREATLTGALMHKTSLAYADLAYADLSYADLSQSDLSFAFLRYSRLPYANLAGADLSHTFLRYGTLSGANLSSANLAFADLINASLARANLRGADLERSNLMGADLTDVFWSDTTCPDGTNSDNDGTTCLGHLDPKPLKAM